MKILNRDWDPKMVQHVNIDAISKLFKKNKCLLRNYNATLFYIIMQAS